MCLTTELLNKAMGWPRRPRKNFAREVKYGEKQRQKETWDGKPHCHEYVSHLPPTQGNDTDLETGSVSRSTDTGSAEFFDVVIFSPCGSHGLQLSVKADTGFSVKVQVAKDRLLVAGE